MECLFTVRLQTACALHFLPSIIIGSAGVGRIREAAKCKLITKWALFRFHYSPAGSTINCRLISFGGGEIKQCVTFCHCMLPSPDLSLFPNFLLKLETHLSSARV